MHVFLFQVAHIPIVIFITLKWNTAQTETLSQKKLIKVEGEGNKTKEVKSIACYLQRIGDNINTNYKHQQRRQWWYYILDILNSREND